MAQKKRGKSTSRKKTKKQQKQQEQIITVIVGFVIILLGIFALSTVGFLGIFLANCLRIIGGNTFPVLAIALILLGSILVVKNVHWRFQLNRRVGGVVLCYLSILLFLHIHLFAATNGEASILATTWQSLMMDMKGNRVVQNVGGGMLGGLLYTGTYFLVANAGSYLIASLLFVLGIFLISNLELYQIVEHLQSFGEALHERITQRQARRAERQNTAAPGQMTRAQRKAEKKAKIRAEAEAEWAMAQKNQVRPMTPGEELAEKERDILANEPEQLELAVPIIDSFQERMTQSTSPASSPATESASDTTKEDTGELDFSIEAEVEDRDYELPPSSLLNSIEATDQSGEYQKIEKNIAVLEQTFQSFGVDAKVVKASLGPAVTKFEIQPAVGVKVSKIVSLTDDIALALAAKDLRMEAPIPGKSLIGIEVPNSSVSMVSFREIIEAQTSSPDKLLEVPLGRDISGKVQTADLTKMPHLLIAGSTGSGKSVAINGIITSILMRAKPNEVKLMMVDPKMVELNVYNGIPHLLTPVVTNPRKAAQALQKVVQEMEERYEKFAATGVRNITGYNEFVAKHNLEKGEAQPLLPFIVVIVDELADLMMVASNEVEDAIIRLAQMARAAGIHMILATQRPSVDVITGIIKANVPSRMAFAVSSGTDSRTIIDSNGAEKLLGRGDMLFLPMGENKPIRVQGAFISDQEVERVVTFVTDQQGADYQENMMPTEEDTVSNNPENPQDELYEQAKALVVEMQTASVSLLQRRFRIGYNRAARLIDELEMSGVVGPSEGSKPRKVLLEDLGPEIADDSYTEE